MQGTEANTMQEPPATVGAGTLAVEAVLVGRVCSNCATRGLQLTPREPALATCPRCGSQQEY
jgi:hypothetical protein